MKKSILALILVLLIAEASLLTACGASTSAPAGPPVIRSFTVEKQTVELGESPVFLFEVENASAITITQDGEVVFQIEATGTEGTSRQPLGNVAYALTTDGTQPEQPYPAGIYPVIYKGATTGHPVTIIAKDEEETDIEAVLEATSPSREKALEPIILIVRTRRVPMVAKETRINEFTIKNVEGIVGEPVEFVVDVSNPARVTIEGGHVLGNIFFQQEFASDVECPFDFKATVTGPPPSKKGEPLFYKITVTDRAGQEYSEEESLEGSSCIWK
jgi:hypothetical protein